AAPLRSALPPRGTPRSGTRGPGGLPDRSRAGAPVAAAGAGRPDRGGSPGGWSGRRRSCARCIAGDCGPRHRILRVFSNLIGADHLVTEHPLPGALVSSSWLAAHLGEPGLVVVDGSWYLPA